MTSKSQSRNRSPSLSKYYTPKTSPSSLRRTQKKTYKFGTPTESMKNKFNQILDKYEKQYTESPSAKLKRELSEKKREDEINKKYDHVLSQAKVYSTMKGMHKPKKTLKRK